MREFEWTLRGRCYRLGDDVPHADGVIPAQFIIDRETDPALLVPHLFELTDPGFSSRCRPGDIVVAGRNFGVGQKSTGYIAMQALGLGLVCESMPTQGYRGAVNAGLRVLPRCSGVSAMCETGDALEVDFRAGRFVNATRRLEQRFPGVPEALQELIAQGGNDAWLRCWWDAQRSASRASTESS
jgi:3-isopropylmalate/(R)-2-methylmalate dehydratase small subunit